MAYWPTAGFLNPGPIQPWARIGDNMMIKVLQNFALYRVVFVEQLPPSSPLMASFGAIAANSTLSAQSLQTQLETDGYELFQIRMNLLEDVDLQVYEPQNLPRFVVKNARAYITKKGQKLDPYGAMTEMGIYQDQYPYVDVINNRDYAYTTVRVGFYGFRYRISRLKDPATNQSYPPYNTIDALPKNLPYVAVMAEGFVGLGFERSAL